MDSTQSPYSVPNPYATPLGAPLSQPVVKVANPPTFCTVMFGLSLAFSFLRLLIVPFSIIGYFALQEAKEAHPLGSSVIFEIITGAAMALSGIIGNTLLLFKKGIGIPLGWLLVVSVVASIAVGMWQATVLTSSFGPGTAQFAGAIIGAAFTTILRGTLLGLYIAALVSFSKWHRQQR